MLLFNLFAVAMFCGVASADLWDFSIKQISCIQTQTPGMNDLEFCDAIKKLTTCIVKASFDAKVENRKEVKALITIYDDMCKEGTDLNKLYKENIQCLQTALSDISEVMKCTSNMIKEILDLPEGKRQDPEILAKLTCKYNDETSNCLIKVVENKCGGTSGDFYRKLNEPSSKLLKESCNEKGIGAAMPFLYFSVFHV